MALLADGAPLEVLDRLYADTPDDRRASRVGFVVAAGGEL